jgi:hypothetical protein
MREHHGCATPEKMPPEGGATGASPLNLRKKNQPMHLFLSAWIVIPGAWDGVDGGQNNQIRYWR